MKNMINGDRVRATFLSGQSVADNYYLGRVVRYSLGTDVDRSDCIQVIANDNIGNFTTGFGAYVFESEDIPSEIKQHLSKNCIGYMLNVINITSLIDNDIIEITNNLIKVLYRADSDDNALMVENKCNCNCLICPIPYSVRKSQSPQLSSTLTILSLIKNQPRHLCITGGEPTLLKDELFIILDECNRAIPDTYFTFLSNARMFSYDSYTNAFLSHKPANFLIGVPLYGSTSDIHDKITNTNGSFNQAVRGIENLLKAKVNVEIRIVVNKLNLKNLPELADFIANKFPSVLRVNIMALEMLGNAIINKERIWIPFDAANGYLHDASYSLIRRGIKTYLYNFPLCTIEEKLWPITVKSISDYKVRFFDECQTCVLKEQCGGFFNSTIKMGDIKIKPVVQETYQQ